MTWDRVGFFASRLAPTGDLWWPQVQCGSEPAREGASTVTITFELRPPHVLTYRQQAVGHTRLAHRRSRAADSRPAAVHLRRGGAGLSGAVDQATVAGGRGRGVRDHHWHQRIFRRAGDRWLAVRALGRSLAAAGSAVCRAGSAGGNSWRRRDGGHEPGGQPVRLVARARRRTRVAIAVRFGRRPGGADGRHAAGAGAFVGV